MSRRTWLLWLGLTAISAIVFCAVQVANPQRITPDSMEYIRMAAQLRGADTSEALGEAALARCASLHVEPIAAYSRAVPDYAANPEVEQRFAQIEAQRAGRWPDVPDDWMNPCVAYVLDHPVTTDPRYSRIFDSRPLYPALAAPLFGVTTPDQALVLVSCVLTALAGVAVFGIGLALGWSPPAALIAQVLLYLLPVGAQGARPLTEGTTLLLMCVLLLGSVLAARRPAAGVAVGVAAAVLLTFARYPTGLFIGLAAIGLTLLWLPWLRWHGLRAQWPVLTPPVAALGLSLVVPPLMGWAGGADSLQDVVAEHFTVADRPDPVRLLLAEIRDLVWNLVTDPAFMLILGGVLLLLGLAIAATRSLSATLAICTPLLVALGNVLAHPALGEARRLFSVSGVSVALATGAVVHWALTRLLRTLAKRGAHDV